MGSKKNRSTGTTAQSLGSLQRQNPQQQWGDVFSNAQDFFGYLGDSVAAPFEQYIGRGEETMANNPMAPIFELLGLRANDQMEKEFPGSTTPEPTQPTQPTQPTEPQLDPYEARIQELMKKRGWTREAAIANQQNALGLKTDYNNDGAVTNDEWLKYKQTPAGAAYHASTTGQQPQMPNQVPGQVPGQAPTPYINPQIGNLSPEQMAQIQQFQRYRV